ncbi:GIY-YIG nuclease family protein [Roseospira goensis]|uniref:Uri superfamily endonuclease n=1 Tax=Roseospira goensis TaxID=391922 RepID=A0A7W6WK36_9PROT|nr:GIY-YIG nuclease family protein [Roseospira goensis]MBB4285148.1 Uri superfamily endonuclease [Roseospira goensis]
MTARAAQGKPESVPEALRPLGGLWQERATARADGAVPAVAGAYLLAVWLPAPVALPPRLVTAARPALAPGWVVYAGSARGPGGLRARLARHLRPDKRRRWHVDWPTTAPGARIWVQAVPGGDECALVARLLAEAGATVPVPGFGSSDCRTCPAHLLALPEAPRHGLRRIRRRATGTLESASESVL